MSWAVLLLLALSSYCSCGVAQFVVTQDEAVSVSPGGDIRLSCRRSGGSVAGGNYPGWYHQKEGGTPKLVVGSSSTSNQNWRPSWTSDRFTGSISGGSAVLSISKVQAEDDGVYSCALWAGSAWIFGPGTPLNVITGKVEAPTLSIFPPSVEQLATDTVTYVCLMSDFTPKSFTVTWLVNGKAKSEGVETSQVSKQSNNLYLGSSYLSIRSADYNKNDEVACKVTHEGKDIVQTLTRSECV